MAKTPPGGNGPGKGDGWGGPAKGASTAPRFKPGIISEAQALRHDPEVKASAAERVELLKEHLYRLATTAERQETQMAATVAYLNRELGTPKASVDNTVSGPDGGAVTFTWLPPTE
jgi:hypothetical protein